MDLAAQEAPSDRHCSIEDEAAGGGGSAGRRAGRGEQSKRGGRGGGRGKAAAAAAVGSDADPSQQTITQGYWSAAEAGAARAACGPLQRRVVKSVACPATSNSKDGGCKLIIKLS